MTRRYLTALGLALIVFFHGSIDASFASTRIGRTHLYVLLGFGGNSPGLGEFGNTMERRGIPTTVASYSDWADLATQATAAYSRGELRSIVIVGHSYGARDAIQMAKQLGRSHVPVRLMVTFDPTGGFRTSPNVRRAINYVPRGQQDHFSVIAAHMGDLTRDVISAAGR